MIPTIIVQEHNIMAVRRVMLVEIVYVRLARWIVMHRAPVVILPAVQRIIHVRMRPTIRAINPVQHTIRVVIVIRRVVMRIIPIVVRTVHHV